MLFWNFCVLVFFVAAIMHCGILGFSVCDLIKLLYSLLFVAGCSFLNLSSFVNRHLDIAILLPTRAATQIFRKSQELTFKNPNIKTKITRKYKQQNKQIIDCTYSISIIFRHQHHHLRYLQKDGEPHYFLLAL